MTTRHINPFGGYSKAPHHRNLLLSLAATQLLCSLPFLQPVAALTTSGNSLGMASVYTLDDSKPSESPSEEILPPSRGWEEAFDWLSPFFGIAEDEKRDNEAMEDFLGPSGCWNTTEDGKEVEVECRCAGDSVTDVPTDLAKGVSRISIVRAGMVTLRKGSLQPYASSLKDLVLMNVEWLECIEDHAFENLTELRTIYIDHAPMLKNISDQVFGEHLPRLRILRIMHTGLHTIPNFSNLRVDSILHMIDLENNQIRVVPSNSVKVRSEQFLLNYNLIEEVEDLAFNEAEIARLSLKGNRRLCTIGKGSFIGLQSLRDLDLSETSITQMPTGGLQMLEILRLQDTETLKVIPSVYNFQFLSEAWLTYPYHCCAFKYPATHDPEEHAKHENIVRLMQAQYCASEQAPVSLELRGEAEWTEGGGEELLDSAPTPSARLRDPSSEDKEGEGEFGRVVFYPENKSRPGEPDWNALTGSQMPHFTGDTQFDPYHLDPHRGFGNELGEGNMAAHRTPHSGEDPVAWLRTLFPKGGGVFHQNTVALSPRLLKAFCGNLSRSPRTVECHPEPDPFNPCEDIMGNWWLRVSAWVMAVLSLLGNIAVLVVLLSFQFKMSVSKFLMCNLAIADLCMGAYLTSILVMDARTVGVYFNYAIDWQKGPGCQIAGFLTVFASELSIFTLAMITSERWYAITYAMHLDRRLRVSTATKVMAVGWAYAATVAALPLIGISAYSKTSICLPMENRDLPGKIYLTLLLVINGLALVLISACYGNIYYVIRKNSQERQDRENASNPQQADQGSPQWRTRTNVASHSSSDATVAKRMALLVFTDFACKAPIAFFGLTAMGGMPLIDVTQAKILLVFFYPLNSCANPFLYALLTKQYRRDLFTLLSRHGLFARKAARYKGAFPGVENDAAKERTGVGECKDKKTTGCWQSCSMPDGLESRAGFLNGPNTGAESDHFEGANCTSQNSYQRGSFQTQVTSVDGLKAVPRVGCHSEEAAIEMDEIEKKSDKETPSESEEVSLDRTHSEGYVNYPTTEGKSAWSVSGSPHPIRCSSTRLAISDEQEKELRRALAEASECLLGSQSNALEVTSHI